VLSLTATLGREFLRLEDGWQLALYTVSLLSLVAALGVAVWALLPQKRQVFGATYLASFPEWSQIVKAPELVQGEAMRGLLAGLKTDRELNHRNAQRVFAGFVLLGGGLLAVAVEALIAAFEGAGCATRPPSATRPSPRPIWTRSAAAAIPCRRRLRPRRTAGRGAADGTPCWRSSSSSPRARWRPPRSASATTAEATPVRR
jgi:hypothetical protein